MRPGSRLAVALLTLTFVVLAGEAVARDTYLHDEGLLTHLLASLLGREPLATFFLQKARPPLSLLYAPVAAAGLGPFLWVHALVAALAVPLVASTAHRLGHARPELSAAVVALSPMHVAAGAAGLMNADAVVGVALVAWLWSGGRLGVAGLVMGALVWVRAELAVLAIGLAAVAVVRWRPRVLLGMAGFPVIYGLAGIAYHHDVLWMLHFPPALAEPMPDNPYWASHHGQASLPLVMGALLAITPALAWLGAWRWRDATELERAGLGFAAAFFVALVVLPRWRVFNFDLSPRYLLPVLPFVALAVGRVLASRASPRLGPWSRGLGLLAFAGLSLATERAGGGTLALWAGLGAAMALALGGAGWPRASLVVAGAVIAAGPMAFGGGSQLARASHSPALDEMVARVADHPEWKGRPLYTNEPLLAAYLRRVGAGERDVRYLVQADQLHELSALSNPDNGQRQALLAALRQDFYGTPVLPDELEPEAVPLGAVFLLRDDPRLELVMPSERWDSALRVVHPGLGMRVALRTAAGGQR